MFQNPGLASPPSGAASEATLLAIAGLVTDAFNHVLVTAKNGNGDPTTIVYRTGGASGTIVATITITYDVDGDFESALSV